MQNAKMYRELHEQNLFFTDIKWKYQPKKTKTENGSPSAILILEYYKKVARYTFSPNSIALGKNGASVWNIWKVIKDKKQNVRATKSIF